jgi:hypothetical protein
MKAYLTDSQKDYIREQTGFSKVELEGVWSLIKRFIDTNYYFEQQREESWRMGRDI